LEFSQAENIVLAGETEEARPDGLWSVLKRWRWLPVSRQDRIVRRDVRLAGGSILAQLLKRLTRLDVLFGRPFKVTNLGI